jgi:hypothetical protein
MTSHATPLDKSFSAALQRSRNTDLQVAQRLAADAT